MTRLFYLFALACVIGIMPLAQWRAAPNMAQITATPIPVLPTNTPRSTRTPSAPVITLASSAETATPFVLVVTATPFVPPGALLGRLCDNCSRVRLRKTPGTAGEILGVLDVNAILTITARSSDSKWLKVTTNSGQEGWISAQFVRQADQSLFPNQAIQNLEVAGVAVEASPTPTSAFLASVPGWLTGISSHSREIYLRGRSMGNRSNVFSKVGDSITSSGQFLVPFGVGQYNLGQYGYLSGAIGYFSAANARAGNSFANESLAAGGGWATERLLQSGGATDGACGVDTPLVCEYKFVKPAIALIMVGTNDSGSGSPDVFANNLRYIVDQTIQMGIIPVVSTIPPKNINDEQNARVDAYNNVIRQVAAQYDIPLWDYFSQMVNLPNRGMSADGLHPSVAPFGSGALTPEGLQYGFTLRNLMALQALDAIWKYVMY